MEVRGEIMKVKLIASTDLGELVCGIAARTCVSETCPYEDDPERSMKSLKQALASHHDSVLEHWTATFQVEGISRACSHQLVRHRIASYSQQSQRYVDMECFDYITPPSIEKDPELKEGYDAVMRMLGTYYFTYSGLRGIPGEDARYFLPNACCTDIVMTMNARELRHFFGERCCTRAQWEIRDMAEKMLDEVKKVAPVLFEGVGPKCLRLGYCPEAKGCGMTKERR